MTPDELLKNLEKYSPFQFLGYTDIFEFKNGSVFINKALCGPYTITTGQNGLNLETKGIFPFDSNIKIDFGKSEQIVVNYNKQKLSSYPRNTRHQLAVDGFLIFKSLNIKE